MANKVDCCCCCTWYQHKREGTIIDDAICRWLFFLSWFVFFFCPVVAQLYQAIEQNVDKSTQVTQITFILNLIEPYRSRLTFNKLQWWDKSQPPKNACSSIVAHHLNKGSLYAELH